MAGRRPFLVHLIGRSRGSMIACRTKRVVLSATTHRPHVTCPECLRRSERQEAPRARR